MRFKEFLIEYKLDTKITYDAKGHLAIQGKIDQDGKTTKMVFTALDEGDYWEITFADMTTGLAQQGKTDSGAQFAIKDFVVSCMKTLVEKHNPDAMVFNAEKEDFGLTRSRVYAKIMAREFPQYEREDIDQGDSITAKYSLKKQK